MSPTTETDIQESSFKQRLVGAMVLIALAVIFIPMVLDFRKNNDRTISGSNIPPRPSDFRVEVLPLHSEDNPPTVSASSDGNREKIKTSDIPAAVMDNNKASPEEVKSVVTGKEKSSPAQDAVMTRENKIKPEINISTPVAAPARQKSREVSKIMSEVPAAVAWDIQVGSFSSEENAVLLRDRLRKQGYATFIDKTTVDGQASFRVRVGPELSKSSAKDLRDQLAQEMDINGIVMVH